jgi:hypothetical protein
MKVPAAKRKVLVTLAGLVWTAVGMVLIAMAFGWLFKIHAGLLLSLVIGLIGGAIIYRFGFSKIAARNLTRIYAQAPGKEKVCIFAFQDKRSYLIVTIMITMGYSLRHSPLPKIYLAPMYMAIGLALVFSSVHYYQKLM